ncbi:hypothetical protein QBC34DRAFT_390208 [Podospora aff. communis PSN243]|uniref:GET complex subunit GET2 n=1 Tax=Podospora aff. communis PSN243 TaxID=3040156 RepID=A0AAV9H8Y0_9PEZI|nr:hypothetical protein QBC34DRAFT_390208 [Podospora aff. communis PSN243]
MTEAAHISAEDAAEARAAEQIRIRKERREAKIKAGASSRLDRITGLGGGIQRDPPSAPPASAPTPSPTPAPKTPASAPKLQSTPRQQHDDPEEVDLSQHFYTPQSTQRIPQQRPADSDADAQLRQLMAMGLGGPPQPGAGALPPGLDDDPMMRMMMQMLGVNPGDGSSMPGAAAGGSPFPFPPGAAGANPFMNMPSMPGAPTAAAVIPDRYASLWRLLHTAVALGLGLYIALWTSFTGSEADRERSKIAGGEMADSARNFFYAFATAEAVLLTTRYFMDRGRSAAGGGGILGMVAGFLPQPFKGYVEIGLRYGQIFGTVKADVLVCIFVLGVCAWFRS